MNYPESVQYLYALGNEIATAKLGLERITAIVERMGHPERKYRIVHVAGTNGKGSTCAMIDSALRTCGHRVGLYTSPHLVEPTERIRIDGMPVSHNEFAMAFEAVHKIAEEMLRDGTLDAHPTYFETVTVMAFRIFAQRSVDWAVLETGLGGRLDATNIVQPRLCVITPVDYDHERWLGKSLESIAAEKAGIMKAGVTTVTATQREEVRGVIDRTAKNVRAAVLDASEWGVENLEMTRYGSWFVTAGLRIECPLAGEHQVENAKTAAVALNTLGLTPEQIFAGIRSVRWPGRLERVSITPEIVLDGAHNPAGARALAAYIRRFHSGRKVGLLYGAMRDKAVEEIAEILFPVADEVIVTAPALARSAQPGELAEVFPHANLRTAPDLRAALALPRTCDVLFITGSLYLVGEARALLVQ